MGRDAAVLGVCSTCPLPTRRKRGKRQNRLAPPLARSFPAPHIVQTIASNPNGLRGFSAKLLAELRDALSLNAAPVKHPQTHPNLVGAADCQDRLSALACGWSALARPDSSESARTSPGVEEGSRGRRGGACSNKPCASCVRLTSSRPQPGNGADKADTTDGELQEGLHACCQPLEPCLGLRSLH